jgi:hypothetical protein
MVHYDSVTGATIKKKGGASLRIKLALKFYVAHPTLYTPPKTVTNSGAVRDDHDI